MDPDYTNRMAQPTRRKPGRPPKTEPPEPEVEAVIVAASRVPPVICPVCGRGMQPAIVRTRTGGQIDCQCSLSGCRFVWTPPRVRPLR